MMLHSWACMHVLSLRHWKLRMVELSELSSSISELDCIYLRIQLGSLLSVILHELVFQMHHWSSYLEHLNFKSKCFFLKGFFFGLTRVNPSDPWPNHLTGSMTGSGFKTMFISLCNPDWHVILCSFFGFLWAARVIVFYA